MGDVPSEDAELQSPSETSPTAWSGSGLGQDGEEETDRPKKQKRTDLTHNACKRCRQKKSKCDGKRPICARCEKHAAECLYDVAQEGITRMQNLQNQLDSKIEGYSRLIRLFTAMQQGTDHEATTLLARLRLGESIEDLMNEPIASGTTDNTPNSHRTP